MHEHSRPDRDEYLEIDKVFLNNLTVWELFPIGSNYGSCWHFVANDYGKYDYASVMHYPVPALLKQPFEAEEINGVMVTEIGQATGLSRRDIEGIRKAYGKYSEDF